MSESVNLWSIEVLTHLKMELGTEDPSLVYTVVVTVDEK